MRQQSTRLVAAALASSLVTSCAIPLSGPRASSGSIVTAEAKARRPANEVLLTRRNTGTILGKLVGIDGELVTFLPSPYWNVPTQTVPLDDIVTIEVTDVGRVLGPAVGYSLATGFVVTGAVCGADAKYDEDFTECLAAAALVGGATALVGLAVGAVIDLSRKRTYHFDRMESGKKREVIQRLVAR